MILFQISIYASLLMIIILAYANITLWYRAELWEALTDPASSAYEGADSTSDISRAFIYACVGIPYFLRSKRVRNTFVN